MSEQEDRTEQGTQKKRDEAKEKGQIVRSRELVSFSVVSGILFMMYFTGRGFLDHISRVMGDMLGMRYGRDLMQNFQIAAVETFWMLAPFFAVAVLAGVVSSVAQGGLLIKPINMSLEKLNPLNGIKKLVSLEGLMEGGKSLLKLSAGVLVFYYVVKKALGYAPQIMAMDVHEMLLVSRGLLTQSVLYGFGFFCVVAVIDYFIQRWKFERSIRMSKDEIRQEMKESEGDPQIKARIRSLQRERARRRMMEEVPNATVVITNPTHLAVALRYERGGLEAPRVVAKGAGIIAQNIRAIAKKHGVPLVEDKPLARALFKIKLDAAIPAALYQAVARILAYIYKLQGVA
ncbi:MAG: flagellar biosynthesis protein FlhB [Nitrospirota bacterium]